MSAPGWYPDPDHTPRLRYFDGRQWTPNTAPLPGAQGGSQYGGQGTPQGGPTGQGAPHQSQRPAFQQRPGDAGGPPSAPAGRSNLLLWVAFGVVVVMILGVGTWLVIRNTASPSETPTPTPSVAQPSDPATDPPPPDPDPEPTAPPPPPVEPTELPEAGAVIEALRKCPATATDAVGQQNAEDRYASAAGFSMPAADGFVPTPVPIPWLHGTNSQAKQYETSSWMSSFTVGEARAEDGFTDTGTTAVAMVACMLGSDFYNSVSPVATVTGSARAPEGDAVKLTVDVAVTGVADVTMDAVYILVVKDLDVMHVLIATVPDTDPTAAEALKAIDMDMRVD